MSQLVHVQERLTHRYNDDYAHLDNWRYLGRVKVLGGREVEPDNGYDEAGAYLMHAVAPRGLDPKAVRQALRDSFTRSGCSHEYDCCGCVSSYARVRQITPRTFSVLVRSYRNY